MKPSFSLKWLFVGMATVGLAITAVQNANRTWLFITVVATMLALRLLAQLPHFTKWAVGGFWVIGLLCLLLISWIFSPHHHAYQGEGRGTILFCIGLLCFVCVQGVASSVIHRDQR